MLMIGGCKAKNVEEASVASAEETQTVESTEAPVKQEIVVAVTNDTLVDQLDAASYNGSMETYQLIYEGLVDYGHKGEILPAVAKSWDVSEDGKTYTFYLREGYKFSDGSPCDAEAVKFSIERWATNPDNNWLKVASDFESVSVIDATTIQLSLNTNYHRTLDELSFPRPVRILSPNSVDPAGDPKGTFVKAIGSGPWMVDEYVKDQKTVFVPNPNYWGEQGVIEKMTFKLIPDVQTRMMALQSGDVDIAGGQVSSISVDNISTLASDNNLDIKTTASSTSYLFVCNTENDILQDKNVRKAIGHAIDKEGIAKNLFDGIGKGAKGLFQDTVPFVTEENNKGYDYNPEKAQSLLENSGWVDTDEDGILDKNGKPLSFTITLQVEEYSEWKPLCEAVQYDLQKTGIKAELKILEKGAYYDALWSTRDFDLLIYRTYSDAWNPLSYLTSLFYLNDEGKAVAYGTKELNNLIDSVSTVSTKEERQAVYDNLFAYMYEEAACIPVFYPEEIFVSNKRIANVKFGPTTYYPIEWEALKVIQE
jgi:peptide/nickel transport system substrate-binding protein